MTEPTLRWGSSGPSVRRLQELLAQRGYDPGPVDGRFGAKTHNAVLRFQRASGLAADGVVGPRTWEALLGAPAGGGGAGQPPPVTPTDGARGLSIHIGVNRIDPAHYGTAGVLHGCENDARAMEALARAQGFEPRMLLTTDATSAQVLAALRDAASRLRTGDILLLTYAGHGAQVPDLDDEAEDRQDETWCLYDRMVLDDELYAAWGQFAAGVRIAVLSDSCHSGTVTRHLVRETSIVKEMYYASLAAPAPARDVGEAGGVRAFLASLPLPRSAAAPAATRAVDGGAVLTRNLPQPYVEAILQDSRDLYRSLKAGATRAGVQATVLAISGCQDNQLSQESGGRGLFSTTLEAVWAGGTFQGDYRSLHAAIVGRMPPTQTPNLTVVGAPNPAFEAQRPFVIAGSRAVAAARPPGPQVLTAV
jgi:hypothetical protein